MQSTADHTKAVFSPTGPEVLPGTPPRKSCNLGGLCSDMQSTTGLTEVARVTGVTVVAEVGLTGLTGLTGGTAATGFPQNHFAGSVGRGGGQVSM